MDRSLLALEDEESLTCTVKLKTPSRVRVPYIFPFESRVNPSGRLPVIICQVYGFVPPCALK
jgi:hypothetical protein